MLHRKERVLNFSSSNIYYESKKGRYGMNGYRFNIYSPTNQDTGEVFKTCFGALEKYK